MINKETVKIESIGANAVGVSKLKDGKICFVPFSLVDEICEIEIIEDHKDYSVGMISKLIEKSDKRIEPACPIFQRCGGCNFLYTTYENEINIKKNVVLEILSKIGKVNYNNVITFIISENRFFYRNNVQIKTTDKGEIGFYAPKTLKVVPFPNYKCLLLTKNMQDFVDNIDKNYFLFTKGFILRDGIKIYTSHLNYNTDSEYCEYKVNQFIYRVGIADFFQVNSFLLDRFQDIVVSLIDKDLSTIELYGGSGFFSLAIAKNLKKLTVNEISKRATANGIFNAKKNNIENIEFIPSDASIFIKRYNDAKQILVDPPRAGMEKDVIETIKNSQIKKIIYVSCNPATFARDLSILSNARFKLVNLYLIDNFPSTYHIELISEIIR